MKYFRFKQLFTGFILSNTNVNKIERERKKKNSKKKLFANVL